MSSLYLCHMMVRIKIYIKHTDLYYLDTYKKLCNEVFNSGIIPESWLVDNIKPICKNNVPKELSPNYYLKLLG